MKCGIEDLLIVAKIHDDDQITVTAVKYKGAEVKLPKECLPIVVRNGVTAWELYSTLASRCKTIVANNIEELIIFYHRDNSQLTAGLRR
jgi:hypothetical protein